MYNKNATFNDSHSTGPTTYYFYLDASPADIQLRSSVGLPNNFSKPIVYTVINNCGEIVCSHIQFDRAEEQNI